MPTLHQDHPVHILDLGDDENRFAPTWLATVDGLLDTVVELSESPARSVLDWAAQHDVDLVAMSTHGRSGFRRSPAFRIGR